jgi:ArsR family transcriptional regulator
MNERRELAERQAIQVAQALAAPTRLNILRTLLQRGELSCGELAEQFPVTQSTVSHHLSALVQAELVAMRKQGQRHYFRAVHATLQAFAQWLTTLDDTECNPSTLEEAVSDASTNTVYDILERCGGSGRLTAICASTTDNLSD